MLATFLPGPFAETDMLVAILGAAGSALDPEPATLDDHALFFDPHGARLVLAHDAGAQVAGAVAKLGVDAVERLAFALAAFGGAVRPVSVTLPQHGSVRAYLQSGDRLPPARFAGSADPEWRAHLAEAAAEAMSHFGDRPAETISEIMQGVSYRALARVRGLRDAGPARARRGMSAADVEPLALHRPYARYFAIEEHRLRHRRFDGSMSGAVERAVFASGDAVTVLPYDPRRRSVLLIEQFRVGPLARRDPHPWRLEAVAGRCDVGEDTEATARREALEEAGLVLGRIERIAGYYTSPGIMAEYITAFVGDADLAGAGGVHGLAEEHEDIRTIEVPLAEAFELVRTGEVNNAPLLISLLWLGTNAERLNSFWAAG